MLDNAHQITAYNLLKANPIHTAVSITQAGDTSTDATAKATSLTALNVATLTYPATITDQVTQLTKWTTRLTQAATTCEAFKTTITPYQTPTNMIELYLGWQCWCKVNNLPENTPFRTNDAVADTTVVNALKTAVAGINLADLVTAWGVVNTALTPTPASGGSSGSGSPAPTLPTLSTTQVTALTAAMTVYGAAFDGLTDKIAAVATLTTNAKADADHADEAYHRAINVAVLQNLATTPILTSSLNAIITPAISQALQDSINNI